MNSLKKLFSFIKPHPERRTLTKEFRAYRNEVGRMLQRPSGLLATVAWLGFAFDTDPKLHPEMPELFWFRMGLTFCGMLVFIISFFEKLRGAGLGWLYFIMFYLFFSTAFFTGRLADDANYVSGLQIIVMICILAPTTISWILALYAGSLLFFATGIYIQKPTLNTPGTIYSMQNLAISYIIGIVFGFVLDNARFDSFYKNRKLKENRDEIEQKMRQVETLKKQQDGDYFLTSLLLQPLVYNGNKTSNITTEFKIVQKKQFEFGSRRGDIGGDICISGNLRMGRSLNNHRRFVVFMNADAMGKSIQGAGGALVAGVLMNSIMAQSARNNRILNSTPEEWLTRVFEDFNRIFLSFDGSMLLSAVVGLIAEDTGELWYFNAEHPTPVLYRNHEAFFLPTETHLYKLGAIPNPEFCISKTILYAGDVLLIASDGRDDIELVADDGKKYINEDENLFLHVVQTSHAATETIFENLQKIGNITDDFSLIKIEIKELKGVQQDKIPNDVKKLIQQKRYHEALACLKPNSNSQEERRLYAGLLLKTAEYQQALPYLEHLYQENPQNAEDAYRYAVACYKTGQRQKAQDALQQAITLDREQKKYQNLLKKLHTE